MKLYTGVIRRGRFSEKIPGCQRLPVLVVQGNTIFVVILESTMNFISTSLETSYVSFQLLKFFENLLKNLFGNKNSRVKNRQNLFEKYLDLSRCYEPLPNN